jgi:class 3 adenylate cyclase
VSASTLRDEAGRARRARGSGRGGEAERRRTGARLPRREVATGLVVVGDLIGEGPAREQAVGERPNLAARLQVLAGPGGVVTVFLASDAASSVTGAVLFADGERTTIDGSFTSPRDASLRACAAAVAGAFTTRPRARRLYPRPQEQPPRRAEQPT